MPCDSTQRVHLTVIYDNAGCLYSFNLLYITCVTGTTHTSIQSHQSKFDTNVFTIGIDNQCCVTMSHSKQDFVRTLKILWRIINRFEGSKVCMIYEGIIAWTIIDYYNHPHQVEMPNSFYYPKGREWLISPQHWSQNTTSNHSDATTMFGTRCVTYHDLTILIWVGGIFVFTVTLNNFFKLYRLRMATLCALHIVLLLVMIHIYMMIILTIFLTTFLFSVSLRSLT